jgi:hypothetical protein
MPKVEQSKVEQPEVKQPEDPTSSSRHGFLYPNPNPNNNRSDNPLSSGVTETGVRFVNPAMDSLRNFIAQNNRYNEFPDISKFQEKNADEEKKKQEDLSRIARDLYGSENPFICEFNHIPYIFENETSFFEKFKQNYGEQTKAELESNKCVEVKFNDNSKERTFKINVVEDLDRKVQILKEKLGELVDEIKQYEQQLSGCRLGGEICRCEVVRIVDASETLSDETQPNREIYTAGELKDLVNELKEKANITETKSSLGNKIDAEKAGGAFDDNNNNSKYEIRFISLNETAGGLKQELEKLKSRVKEDAEKIFEMQYDDSKDVIYKFGDQLYVENNMDSLRSMLNENKLNKEIIDQIINHIKGEKNGELNADNEYCKEIGGKFELFDGHGNSIGSVEKLGLRDASKELEELRKSELKAIKEKLEKLGRNDIVDDKWNNPKDISLYRFDHEGKVYIATSPEALEVRLYDERVSIATDRIRELKGLKGLDDINKALKAEIDSLEKRKQDAAKAIFGVKEEWKDAFCLKIPMPKREGEESVESEYKDLKDGIIECRVNDQEIIGFYKNPKSFDGKYEILKDNADNQVTIDKIDKGGKFAIVEKNGGENRGQFTCERLDLYKETADIEVCRQKFGEEVKKLYEKVTGVKIADSSDIYAHKFNDKVYITTEPELKEDNLREVRRQCSEQKKNDYVKEDNIKNWRKLAEKAKPPKDAKNPVAFGKQHSIGWDEAYRELKVLADKEKGAEKEDKEPKKDSSSEKPEKVSGEQTNETEQKETNEAEQEKTNEKVAELYAMDGIKDGKFYAYEVEGEKSEKEFGVFVSHEKALEEIKARFDNTAMTKDKLELIDVGGTIRYVSEDGKEFICRRIGAEDLLKLEKEQVKDIVKLNKHLGGSDTIKGIDKAEDKDKPWESIRCYEIKVDGGKPQYEVAENPGSMAERIAEHFGGIEKVFIVPKGKKGEEGSKVENVPATDINSLAKKINERGCLTVIGEGDKSLTIEGVEQSKIKEKIGEEIKEITKKIIRKDKQDGDGGLLRRYYKARDLSDSLAANNSLNVKLDNIHHGSSEFENWKSVHAAMVTDEKGKKKIMFTQGEGKLENGGISLKDAKQRLEKLVEKKEVPIKFGKLIGKQLEGKIKERFGIKDGSIEYCFIPPKCVFECEDSNGRKTYYFTNDKKGPGKKEGLKVIRSGVPLDGEALRVLEESIEQGNFKIINLKDMYMFKKGENGKTCYITNNGKFGNTPYGVFHCPDMGMQIHDFMDDPDDSDKKSWWRSIFSGGGDGGYSRDDEDNGHSTYYNQLPYQNFPNQTSGSTWNPWNPVGSQ